MEIAPLFLYPMEIEMLTGFKTNARQIEWLRKKGWRFELSGSNRPVVSRRYAESLLGCEGQFNQSAKPNFDALRAM